jgi:hypothetical protein
MEKNNSFEKLALNGDLIKGINLYGFTQPSNIQIKSIEAINTSPPCRRRRSPPCRRSTCLVYKGGHRTKYYPRCY